MGCSELGLRPRLVVLAGAFDSDVYLCVSGMVVVRVHDNAVRTPCESESHRGFDGNSHPDYIVGLRVSFLVEPRGFHSGRERARSEPPGESPGLDDRFALLRGRAGTDGDGVRGVDEASVGEVFYERR